MTKRANSQYGAMCSTAAKRKAAANKVCDVLRDIGVPVTVQLSEPRAICLLSTFGPYRCSMEFNGASDLGAFLAHWFTDTNDRDATYSFEFESKARSHVNAYHRRKATTCCDGFDQFLTNITTGFLTLWREKQGAKR